MDVSREGGLGDWVGLGYRLQQTTKKDSDERVAQHSSGGKGAGWTMEASAKRVPDINGMPSHAG
jgi:hypothetical protein